MRFSLVEHARLTGAALVMMPVQIERTPPATGVTVPPAFVDCQRVDADGHLSPAAAESRLAANVKLRFQLPSAVMPMTIDQARLTIKIHAPARDVVVNALAGNEPIKLHQVSSPDGIVQIDIGDARVLKVDDQGVFYMNIILGELKSKVERDTWRIEWPGLQVKGRT
jgi:hypothetical protein